MTIRLCKTAFDTASVVRIDRLGKKGCSRMIGGYIVKDPTKIHNGCYERYRDKHGDVKTRPLVCVSGKIVPGGREDLTKMMTIMVPADKIEFYSPVKERNENEITERVSTSWHTPAERGRRKPYWSAHREGRA